MTLARASALPSEKGTERCEMLRMDRTRSAVPETAENPASAATTGTAENPAESATTGAAAASPEAGKTGPAESSAKASAAEILAEITEGERPTSPSKIAVLTAKSTASVVLKSAVLHGKIAAGVAAKIGLPMAKAVISAPLALGWIAVKVAARVTVKIFAPGLSVGTAVKAAKKGIGASGKSGPKRPGTSRSRRSATSSETRRTPPRHSTGR